MSTSIRSRGSPATASAKTSKCGAANGISTARREKANRLGEIVALTASDVQRLKSDPRFTAAHAALLDIMIRTGEVILETAAPLTPPAPQGVRA